jgi:anti-sigma B factor antagonist
MPESGLVISQIQEVTVVSFRNRSILDSVGVEAISRELYALVDEQARKKIVLDFSNVRFLSSQMLGVLIALHKKLKEIGGRYVIAGLQPELHRVFRITRLDKVLDFAPDETKALAEFDVYA